MAKKKPTTKKSKLIADQAEALAEFAATAYVAADQLQIKTKPVKEFPLDEDERATLAEISVLPPNLKKKLTKKNAAFTVVDVASMVMTISESFIDAKPQQKLPMLLISKKLMDCLEENIVKPDFPAKAKTAKPTGTVYQFKITLLESYPPIWRRIQIEDCSLDKLHEHIQTAMGWTNSHLHHFKLGEEYYGDRMLMGDNYREFGYHDSTITKLSDILPKTKKRFRLVYEYDFGDSWDHEILFEGVVQPDSKIKYPLCLEGARACPPEDCGGIWGYPDFLETISNPEHERHEEMLDWIGGSFDSEEFDPVAATKAMKKGLKDWR